MSICSTHSSGVAPDITVSRNGIQVDHDEVERLDVELVQLLHVRLEPEVGEDAGVDLRVQRLDPAVETLGEAGELLDRRDRDAGGLDGLGRRAGRHDRDAGGMEVAGELVESGLVVHGHEGAAQRSDVGHEVSSGFVFPAVPGSGREG